MKMSILGDFVRITGKRHEVEEMTRILRNTVLDGTERAKVVCKTASSLSKILKNNVGDDIDDRFAFRNLSEYFKSIMKDLMPKSFHKIKYMEVETEPEVPQNHVIYCLTKGIKHEIFILAIPSDEVLEPVFVPKDYKDVEFIKPEIEEK